jgi:hypothetical protein
MSVARKFHTARLLANGKVLVVGAVASAALYDPLTGLFTSVGALIRVRSMHSATLLGNGSILIVGGAGRAGSSTTATLKTAEMGSV